MDILTTGEDLDPDLLRDVIETGKKAGANKGFWINLVNNIPLFKEVVKLVALSNQPFYSVTVDYNLTLRQMMDAGDYFHTGSWIFERTFPTPQENRTALIKVYLAQVKSKWETDPRTGYLTCGVVDELAKMGLRPATLPELLALGAFCKNIPLEHPVVALGSTTILGYRKQAVYLDNSMLQYRSLLLVESNWQWDDNWRFAGVPQ